MPSGIPGPVSIAVRHDHKYAILRIIRAIMAGIARDQVNPVLTALVSLLFVSTAWTVIFAVHDLSTRGIVRLLVRRAASIAAIPWKCFP